MNKTPWQKAGRFVTPIIVLCFFLPFFGVSCNGMDVLHVSGADLVFGGEPDGMITELAEQTTQNMETGEVSVTGDMSVDPEPLAIAAAAIALFLVGIAWIRTRFAVIAAMVFGLAGFGALVGLYVQMQGRVDDERAQQTAPKSEAEREFAREIEQEIHIDFGGRVGFWLASAGFIAVAALAGTSLRQRPPAA